MPISHKISFWNNVQKGTNIFNISVTREDIKAAKAYGIAFIRLSPDKFKTSTRDFLIGNPDSYAHLNKEDLAALIKILDMCAEEKMPIVITMLSLPGSRWKQKNNDKDDLRIWTNPDFQKQAIQFWQDLTLQLKDHPAIVGYNILNEPHLEKTKDSSSKADQFTSQWVQETLYQFYHDVITAIRSVDKDTPIILDSSLHADPQTFGILKIQPFDNIIYSFHMYEPYTYTNLKLNKGKLIYPGLIDGKFWDKSALQEYIKQVVLFQDRNHIPSNRILVGEFGGNRKSKGLVQYFQDLIDIFKENKWHFAFYSFREDNWDEMNYELGDKNLGESYWKSIDKGEKPELKLDGNAPTFKVLWDALKA